MITRKSDCGIQLLYGPVSMHIQVWREGVGDAETAQYAAEEVVAEFERLMPYMEPLRAMRYYRQPADFLPQVLNKMIAAVERSGCAALNTLGAVAGAFAEYAVEIACKRGATRAIVNNGGDIALLNRESRPVGVGIPVSHGHSLRLVIKEEICGVCTSGVGGRSFSKGIADGVTVLAASAPLADACATVIANAVDVDDPAILRCRAEEIDSGTDIAGQMVTLHVGQLSASQKRIAVLRGAETAQRLYDTGVIAGAVICLGDLMLKLPDSLPVRI